MKKHTKNSFVIENKDEKKQTNSSSLYEFMGYLADKAGYLDEIYQQEINRVNVEIRRKRREYTAKNPSTGRSRGVGKRTEIKFDDIRPEKDYLKMFSQYLEENELTIYDSFKMKIEEKWYIFQVKTQDEFCFERIQDLPDGVILFMDGRKELFQEQFNENMSLKSSMIMHLFFGTQKIYMFYYYDWRDHYLKHECEQLGHNQNIEERLSGIFDYLESEYEAPCHRIERMPVCLRLRTDRPQVITKKGKGMPKVDLASNKIMEKKILEKNSSWFSLDFLKSIV